MGRLARALLGITPDEASPARRGFHVNAAAQDLEEVGRAFVCGYNAALLDPRPQALESRLALTPPAMRGFAYEGAAMALALLDLMLPWRASLWQQLHAGSGARHTYMLHVGAGWALARLPVAVDKYLERFDPLLRWLVVDGYGFHEGYFHAAATLGAHRIPARLAGYARRAFDQGLGRSLWFVCGADPQRVAHSIASFAPPRQDDLWGGVGLAATYAGAAPAPALQSLALLARQHAGALAQGAAFAAKARLHAGNPVPHNELACHILARTSLAAAAAVTDTCLDGLQAAGPGLPAYEIWRRRIGEALPARERAQPPMRTAATGGVVS
ncbi:MAG: DUF1702 family protein [Rhodocyclaceae bacterium]|nr:DUF1702 family protein [Rhodocyclaceae bacterium]